jgi:hypothetical protein
MEFGCSICEYTSFVKRDVQRHINRKKSCGIGIKTIIEIPIEIKCEHCNKCFSTKANLKDHMDNNCKYIKSSKKELKELKELKEFISSGISSGISQKIYEQNYIYLILIYPYLENIFKIGRSTELKKRLATYKKHKVVFIMSCEDEVKCERDIIQLFREKCIERKDYGNEYFTGEYENMKQIILDYFANNSNKI